MFRSPFRTVVLPAVIVAIVAAALAGPGFASRTRATAAVTVTATEFKFKLSKTSVAHGSIVFTLVNKGKLPHDFKIGGKKTPLVAPGKTAKLTVTLTAGKKPYLCTVKGHAAAGMKGNLTVT
jgi:uncharacterized cupredoxin-like copper-binding protein